MLQLNSALVSIAAEFTGRFAPYQAVEISPAPKGGVYVASTDKGNIACLAHDPGGQADETIKLMPDPEMIRLCRGIKTAERELKIDGNNAIVTTFRKTTSERKEIIISRSISEFPPLSKAVNSCVQRWSDSPEVSATAGRYESRYVERALKGLSGLSDSVILSAFDGGPLRIQTEAANIVVLVMPQTAEKIPVLPEWLKEYAQSGK
tara:strand:- start:62 stop:679 length:618 start_codon:yes stop_codon:yes gene_type:complete